METTFTLTLKAHYGYKDVDADFLAMGLAAGLGCYFYGSTLGGHVTGFVPENLLEAAHAAACRLMDARIVEEYTTKPTRRF